jgi:hypothetical protein
MLAHHRLQRAVQVGVDRLRHRVPDHAADELVDPAAEQLRGAMVQVAKAPRAIHGEDRIGDRLQQDRFDPDGARVDHDAF